jgi:hypothetical protein
MSKNIMSFIGEEFEFIGLNTLSSIGTSNNRDMYDEVFVRQ